jgi:hypothetical protein
VLELIRLPDQADAGRNEDGTHQSGHHDQRLLPSEAFDQECHGDRKHGGPERESGPHHGQRLAPLRAEETIGRDTADLGHQALAREPQAQDSQEQHDERGREGGSQQRGDHQQTHGDAVAAQIDAVDQGPEERQQTAAQQRGRRVEQTELGGAQREGHRDRWPEDTQRIGLPGTREELVEAAECQEARVLRDQSQVVSNHQVMITYGVNTTLMASSSCSWVS